MIIYKPNFAFDMLPIPVNTEGCPTHHISHCFSNHKTIILFKFVELIGNSPSQKSKRSWWTCKNFDLMYPHRKKSQGVKSGERAGQSLSPSQVITRPGNISCKRSCTISARCAGAPSCAHHKRSKCSSCICSLKCCTKTGKTSSTIISWYFCLL